MFLGVAAGVVVVSDRLVGERGVQRIYRQTGAAVDGVVDVGLAVVEGGEQGFPLGWCDGGHSVAIIVRGGGRRRSGCIAVGVGWEVWCVS